MERHKKKIAADYASDIPALYPINRFNLGNVYFQQKKFGKAETLLLESVQMAQKILNQPILAEGNILLGQIHTQRGEFDLARTHLQKGLSIATAINPKTAANAHAALRDWAAAKKDYPQALAYAKKFQELRDSVYNTEKVKIAENLEIGRAHV